MSELDDNAPARGESSNSSPADVCTLGSSTGITSQCTTSHKPGNSGEKKSSENADAAEEADQLAEPALCCIHGINQVVLVIQPDDSTQYMLLSEEKALREAAAKQAALEAAEQGLVPVDPRDAAIMQAIEDGDAAVQRVFQERLRASLYRTSQCLTDSQPPEGSCERSQGDGEHGRDEEEWLAQLQAADMALTAQLNSRDAALSARI